MQILERRGEGSIAPAREEGAHAELLPRSVAELLAVSAALAERRDDGVLRLVFFDQRRDLLVPHFGNPRGQVTDRVTVDGPAKLDLRLEPVAARHGDLTHVHAAKAHHLESPRF